MKGIGIIFTRQHASLGIIPRSVRCRYCDLIATTARPGLRGPLKFADPYPCTLALYARIDDRCVPMYRSGLRIEAAILSLAASAFAYMAGPRGALSDGSTFDLTVHQISGQVRCRSKAAHAPSLGLLWSDTNTVH